MQMRKVIISGGGTGGHIFPALAIADGIMARFPNCEILFVGAKGKMEMERVPKAGYKIVGLDIRGLQRSFSRENLKFPFRVMSSIVKARKLLRDFKPDLAVGVGGYASGPLLYAASKKKIPTLIQEQNSYAGITNKILGKQVDKVCVAYEAAKKFFPVGKTTLTGNPVRQQVYSTLNSVGAKEKLGLNANAPMVLVVGGSLGARKINEGVKEILPRFQENNIQLLWQTGKTFFDNQEQELQGLGSSQVLIQPFIDDMATAYAAADVVVSRAGALAITELQVLGKPCILVPSPYVAENHQYKNADALVANQAAVLVEEQNIKKQLWQQIETLLTDEGKRTVMAANLSAMATPNAVKDIVEIATKLVHE